MVSAGDIDAQDRLMRYGDWTYTYTANGELLTKTKTSTGESQTFSYDAFGNLVSVVFKGH